MKTECSNCKENIPDEEELRAIIKQLKSRHKGIKGVLCDKWLKEEKCRECED